MPGPLVSGTPTYLILSPNALMLAVSADLVATGPREITPVYKGTTTKSLSRTVGGDLLAPASIMSRKASQC